MFAKETYIQRRALLKKNIGSGVLLFLGNDEQGLHYEDNTFRYRQDSTFLYYFGLSFAGLFGGLSILMRTRRLYLAMNLRLTISYGWERSYPEREKRACGHNGSNAFCRNHELSA